MRAACSGDIYATQTLSPFPARARLPFALPVFPAHAYRPRLE